MAKKNGKEKAVTAAKQRERQPHPFGEPSERAKNFHFPSPNPTLIANEKSTEALPQNLRSVHDAVAKHKNGLQLKDLKVAKLGEKTLHWLVRQLAKHEFLRVKAEEKPAPKKTSAAAKKEEK